MAGKEIIVRHDGWRRRIMVGAVAILGLAMVAGAEFTIERYSIDGGGGTHLQGGRFELHATIGQGDASVVMTSEPYTLTAGLWFPLNAGDCDVDGVTGLFDFDRFADCQLGPAGGIVDPDCACFDADGDDDVDLVDFGMFQVSVDSV